MTAEVSLSHREIEILQQSSQVLPKCFRINIGAPKFMYIPLFHMHSKHPRMLRSCWRLRRERRGPQRRKRNAIERFVSERTL